MWPVPNSLPETDVAPRKFAVMHRQVHVRKSRAAVQWSKAATVVLAKTGTRRSVRHHRPHQGWKWSHGPERKPADRTPAAAKAESKSETTAESKERNISRSPNRAVIRISVSRTGPPAPRAVVHHPATVVIRRPAPGIVRNPGPSPIRLIHPAAIPIRSPARGLVWPPHWTVIRNFRPRAVGVKILGSDVIVVGAPPRFRVADHVVAIGVPLVPVISGGGFADLVLRVRAAALNGDELALADAGAALRSRNFDFAFADQHFV